MAGGEGPTMSHAPTPQQRRVVDFVRLLQATQQSLEKGPLVTAGPADRAYQLELCRFNVFLRTLREQLTDLHSLDLGLVATITPKTLQGYSFQVDALERTLLARQQELRRFKASGATGAGPGTHAPTTSVSSASSSSFRSPRGPSSESAAAAAAAKVPPAPTSSRTVAATARSNEGKGGEGMDREAQEKLNREKETQEVLTEQLQELVGALKASSILVHSSLREQNKVLDKTENAAQRNLESLQDELHKTEEQLKRSWNNSLTSCVMIFMMLAIFIGTFFFMKLFPKRRWTLW